MSKSAKTVPAVVEFYDIAGLVKGANKGEGLGNQFLSHIREVSAIVMVLRCFENKEIIHVENSIDPIRDLEIINAELALKDLETVEKKISGKKETPKDLEVLKIIREKLSKNELIVDLADEPLVKNMQLLTAKKQIYLLNGDPEDISEDLRKKISNLGGIYIVSNLGNDKGASEALAGLIKEAYRVLGLISFFTTGELESRAWTIGRGSKAPQAAGTIHTDFEKKFIKAEVINWQKLVEAGSWVRAKNKGLIRLEGKEYIVQEGDVMIIKHS